MGFEKKLVILSVLLLFVTPLILAQESEFTFEKNQNASIIINCENRNISSYCSTSGRCNLTIAYPNSTIFINNQPMTNQAAFHNYTLSDSQLDTSGEYQVSGICIDGGSKSFTFPITVNPTGIPATDQRTSAISFGIIFLGAVAVMLFLAFMFLKTSVPTKWTFFFLSVLFALASLNILFVNIQDSVVNPSLESFFDTFTAIAFIGYYAIAGLLAIMWAFTFWQTWKRDMDQKAAMKFGEA